LKPIIVDLNDIADLLIIEIFVADRNEMSHGYNGALFDFLIYVSLLQPHSD
jgi:hypothetical protein